MKNIICCGNCKYWVEICANIGECEEDGLTYVAIEGCSKFELHDDLDDLEEK